MLYTDRFLFLHIPKTGGTFARIAIRNALTHGKIDLAVHRLAFAKPLNPIFRLTIPGYRYKYREIGSQHSFWKSVPGSLRQLRVLSIVRNPIQWAYSHYKFGVTRDNLIKKKGIDPAKLSTFDNFMDIWDRQGTFAGHSQNQGRIGNLSSEFICFFLDIEDRPKVFSEFPDIEGMCEAMRYYMPAVNFVRNETLNEGLSKFFDKCGYSRQVCDEIRGHRKVNVSRKTRSDITSHAKDLIHQREAFLYEMFPEYMDAR